MQPGVAVGGEGEILFAAACHVSSSSAAGDRAGMEAPPFRVKPPVALLVNLSIHPGARAQSGTERETSSVPSWPGLLPPSDPEGLERVGRLGRQAEPTAKAEERKQPSYFTHFAERKQRL